LRTKALGSQGRVLWDTRAVDPGTYTAELVDTSGRSLSIRIVVKP
jgi:predicted secreted protein